MTIMRYSPRPRFADLFDNLFEREFDHMQRSNSGYVPRTNIAEKEDKFQWNWLFPDVKKRLPYQPGKGSSDDLSGNRNQRNQGKQ